MIKLSDHFDYLPSTLQLLLPEEVIQKRIKEMAAEINETYRHSEVLTMVCILKGGFMFLSDLAKHIEVPCQIEFVKLSSYGNGHTSSGVVKPVDLTLPPLQDRDILLVEDIVDTGLTLSFFMEYLESLHIPKTLRLAVLLDKKEARRRPVQADFTGFEIEDRYVVGYGLDSQGLYRNLPFIAYFNE